MSARRSKQQQTSGKIAKKQEVNRRIEKLANAIRHKYMTLKLGTAAAAEMSQKLFKPVTDPLEKIVETITNTEPTAVPTQQPIIVQKEIRTIKRQRGRPIIIRPEKSRRLSDVREMIDKSTATPTEEEEEVFIHVPDEEASALSDSVEEIQAIPKTERAKEEYLAQYSPLAASYIRLMMETNDKEIFDRTFGPTPNWKTEKWTIGNKPFSFKPNDNIMVGDREFPGTQGLYELLLMNKPNEKVIKEKDRKSYKEILKLSSVHRVNNDPKGKIRSSVSTKYKRFVGPIMKPKTNSVSNMSSIPQSSFRVRAGTFPGGEQSSPNRPSTSTPNSSSSTSGKGLGDFKVNTNNRIEYVYWNDINELVGRLRLLYASKMAGNTAHDNEIVSILEELREEGIIV